MRVVLFFFCAFMGGCLTAFAWWPKSGKSEFIDSLGISIPTDAVIFARGETTFEWSTFITTTRVSTSGEWNPTADQPDRLRSDVAFCAGTLSDLFVVLAVLFLDDHNRLPFSRHLPIPVDYLPSVLADTGLRNPFFPYAAITLDTLLQHTSSLTDDGFDLGALPAPKLVATLEEFIDRAFIDATDGLFSATLLPGAEASYNFSRMNTALASYIVNRILEKEKKSGASGDRDIADLLFDTILPPLGLMATFALNRTGGIGEGLRGVVRSTPVRILEKVGPDGRTPVTDFTIHAAWTADYMLYITMEDLKKLMVSLFFPGGIYSSFIGRTMLRERMAVNALEAPYSQCRTLGRCNTSHQGLQSLLVPAGTSHSTSLALQLPAESVEPDTLVVGIPSYTPFSSVGVICAFSRNAKDTMNVCCGAAVIAYYNSDAGVTHRDITIMKLALQSVENNTNCTINLTLPGRESAASSKGPSLFTFFIVLGVLFTFALTIIGSCIVDYIVQPAPPAKGIVPILAAAPAGDGMNGGRMVLQMASGATTPAPVEPPTLEIATSISSSQSPMNPVHRFDAYS